jgi:signal peptidase I
MSTATAAASGKQKALMGPVRVNLEAFGVAILAAVLLKWFCIEAFQIPTSSMQPTLMGSNEAAVYDRILVDKILPLVREPKRWDVTVFRYPLQKNQNYVKRIGGMPGDRLTIAGGNLYQVVDGPDGKRSFRVERKPADLQEAMWKNVHPGRQIARAETKALDGALGASPGRAFREADGEIAVDLDGGRALLYFRDDLDGGMIDRVYDGYPEAVARAIRDKSPLDQPQEIVPDARITATLTPAQALDEVAFEVDVQRPNSGRLTFALTLKGGKGQLLVRRDTTVLGSSPEFACELAAGTATEIAFAHVDDELVAWRDGVEAQRFDCAQWAVRDECVLPFQGDRLQKPANQRVVPQIALRGKGAVRIASLRIDRDMHWTRSGAPEVIEVPEGHYYMLGDNTLQSIDSRGWTAITVGVDAEDRIVSPDTPGCRVVRGNKRPMNLANAPDRDETPIPIPEQKAVVMIDEYGEILRLRGVAGPGWAQPQNGKSRVSFVPLDAQDGRGEWEAPDSTNSKGISFVPRDDIQGRAVLVFYPSRPFAWLFGSNWPGRFGFVR